MKSNAAMVSEAENTLQRWREMPHMFVREVFDEKVEPDDWQDEALIELANPKTIRIAIRANKGPGKTAWLAWTIFWFLTCYKNANITATAITGENLRDNLWKELALWRSRSKILQKMFIWSKERVYSSDKLHEASWWCSARKWAKDADPAQQANTLAGLHAQYVMAIVDEAGGVPDGVVDAAEGILANLGVKGGLGKVIITGNPTHVEGPLFRAFEMNPEDWWRLHLTADPLFKYRAKSLLKKSRTRFTNLVSQENYVLPLIKRYTRTSSVVLVNAFGEFPLGVSDAIVTLQQYRNAVTAWGANPEPGMSTKNILGIDIARLGSNETVVARRRDFHLVGFSSWIGNRLTESADKIEAIWDEGTWDEIRIDDVGAGGGVTDILLRRSSERIANENKPPINICPIDVGSSDSMTDEQKKKHLNLRSILFHDLQEMFVDDKIHIHPDIETYTTLMEEGSTLLIDWAEGKGNKRKIEAKKLYKKRTGRSPDYLDAMMLAFADRVGGPTCGVMFSESAPKDVEHPTQLMPFYRERVRLMNRRGRHANTLR